MADCPPALPASPSSKPAMLTPYREWRVLTISCLTSIATIIGSGILALPVTLYSTSVPVFLVLFTVTLFVQIGAIYAVTELMQRAGTEEPETPSYSTIDRQPREVSLFSLAQYYLPSAVMRYAFNTFTFLSFVSLLVSYGLAGPQAIWQLLSSGPTTHPPLLVFAAYWAIGTAAVVFFVDVLLGVFGMFTVLKGVLFVCVVAIVAALPAAARVTSIGTLFVDFSGLSHAAPPLLMSCVALGGLSNTIPVTFKLLPIKPSGAQIARYRAAIVLAVVLCYVLNIGWVLALLQVVPRVAESGQASLTNAYNLGQISTVPLIDTLHQGEAVTGALLKAIEVIVELFIFVSIGVSFFVNAAAMKSFVDGGVYSLAAGWRSRGTWRWVPTALAYTVAFGIVLVIILANPHGFVAVLTRFASIAMNLQAGAFMCIMLYFSRRKTVITEVGDGVASVESGEAGNTEEHGIPLEMPSFTAWAIIVLCLPFFVFACILAAAGPLLGVKLHTGE